MNERSAAWPGGNRESTSSVAPVRCAGCGRPLPADDVAGYDLRRELVWCERCALALDLRRADGEVRR